MDSIAYVKNAFNCFTDHFIQCYVTNRLKRSTDPRQFDKIPLSYKNYHPSLWQTIYQRCGFSALNGLKSDGLKFNQIIGNTKLYTPANINQRFDIQKDTRYDPMPSTGFIEQSNEENGIRFSDLQNLRDVENLCVTIHQWKLCDKQFLWEVKVPDDATVRIGCGGSENHEAHFTHMTFCGYNMSSNKLIIGPDKIPNPHYVPKKPIDYWYDPSRG